MCSECKFLNLVHQSLCTKYTQHSGMKACAVSANFYIWCINHRVQDIHDNVEWKHVQWVQISKFGASIIVYKIHRTMWNKSMCSEWKFLNLVHQSLYMYTRYTILHLKKTKKNLKVFMCYCFFVFHCIGEYISLDLFCFVILTSSCLLIPLIPPQELMGLKNFVYCAI